MDQNKPGTSYQPSDGFLNKISKYKSQVIGIHLFPLTCENTGFDYALCFAVETGQFVFSVPEGVKDRTSQP